jgi:thiamine pyrophosphate-dependent acetolactate synthase large subunit-like protein
VDVATQVGGVLAGLGVEHVFGVVGSGNFHVTNALVAGGARFVPTAHEMGAATAADAYARLTGKVGVVSVHQGPGVTNALTGLTEAAKSRTPLIALAPEATNPRSNFHIDLAATARSIGAEFRRLRADSAAADVADAWRFATTGLGGTVVLGLPLDVQAATASESPVAPDAPAAITLDIRTANAPDIARIADLLRKAERPVFIAGRGAARTPFGATRDTLERLGENCGALLATSAAGHGLFAGSPWNLGISGGFATPLAAELIASADVLVAWGCSLNMWTTRHGSLIPPRAAVVRVDHDQVALDQPLIAPAAQDIRVRGELGLVADAVLAGLVDEKRTGFRTDDVRERIETAGRWRQVPYDDWSDPAADGQRIDPRTLTIALDDIVPAERIVAVDSGNFMGYPASFMSVPDPAGFSFTQAYQSIGLGLASAVGAAIARPDRVTVAALGDGGFLMALAELTTVRRLALPMAIVIYNDAAYGAEVHHFGPDGYDLSTVRFPDADLADIARGFGLDGITVRDVGDLEALRTWVNGPRDRAIVIDAKVAANDASWWLAEAFRGH